MAATGPRMHIVSSLCAFVALLGGLIMLAVHPVLGVLVTVGGMALLLHAAAGLYGAAARKQ